MFERAILHLDLDAFFASVECLQNSSLAGKPLIVGGSSERGVVASCSYEARAFGIRSAMPMKLALRLCPDAIVVRGDMEVYARHSRVVTEIIAEQAPLFEKASVDEFYIDLSGMDKYFGCWKWALELRERIRRDSGLPLSAALSVNKLVSKVGAGEAKPNGVRLVDEGTERAFLAPLPVGKLPSVGAATQQKLQLMGIRHVEALSRVPPLLLQREFGIHGLSLWKKANAIDDSPVMPYQERQSISTEHTFSEDTCDMRQLHNDLSAMTARLAFDLRQAKKLTSCVTVKLRYADFQTYTRQQRIPYTASDAALLRCAHTLFDQLYQRRQSLRLIGVRFSGLVHGSPQLDLFDAPAEEHRLLNALDQIRKKFGMKAIVRAGRSV
jgi:DNA polymerase-4